jgi:HNH endonuclease
MTAERKRKPDTGTGTDAWFKELENRLGALQEKLADAASLTARSTRTKVEVDRHLSIVQELLARIEDRIAELSPENARTRADDAADRPLVQYCEVPGFTGYRVGNDGSIWGSRSAGRGYGRTREWRQLKPYLLRPGPVLAVSLYRERVRHVSRVDEIVLIAFLGPCPDGYEASHTNGDVLDNRRENLCYVPAGAAS